MRIFRKKERDDMIYINNGKNDYRAYPKPGSILNIDLEREDKGKEVQIDKGSKSILEDSCEKV